jgi:serine protease Do
MRGVAVLWVLLCFAGPGAAREVPDFVSLVERHGPEVVNISSSKTLRAPARSSPQVPDLQDDDPLSDYFRRFIPPRPGGAPEPREYESKSLGSGFIFSSDGYILTNAHVVDQADEVLVKLVDKREFRAKVIGADKRTDVALIKIEASGLPKVTLADPRRLKVGEWVLAIGSPFGFENSVTAGIVSAKGRALPQETLVPFIQTDVAINPGNSGGPLFNLRGEVVGINSQIYSRTGGFMGLSFAIPIDVAVAVQQQLREGGRVRRGRIGVVIQEVTAELAQSFGLSKPAGALVNSVEQGGPAAQAGFEPSDIVLSFDGKEVASSVELPRIVAATRPGSRVSVLVWRHGGNKELNVVVGELRESVANADAGAPPPREAGNALGIIVSELSAERRRELRLNGGVVIDEIRGTTARGELRTGDLIISVIQRGQTTEVKSVDQFNRVIGKLDRAANVTFLVRRGETQHFVTIRSAG